MLSDLARVYGESYYDNEQVRMRSNVKHADNHAIVPSWQCEYVASIRALSMAFALWSASFQCFSGSTLCLGHNDCLLMQGDTDYGTVHVSYGSLRGPWAAKLLAMIARSEINIV
jgi:hypothetical protein